MKKIIFLSLGLTAAGLVFLVLARDWILKTGMEQAVTRMTGFRTSIRSLHYTFPSTIRIQDLEIMNPRGFEEKVFAVIPEIYASFFLVEFLKGKGVHYGEVRLDIQEVHIEKTAGEISNIELLRTSGQLNPDRRSLPPPETREPLPFLLEQFEFSLRDVTYQDLSGVYGASGLPNKLSVDMKIQRRLYKDIHDPRILVNLIVAEIIREETFGRLLNLDAKDLLGENMFGILNTGQEFVGEQAMALGRGTGSVLQDSFQGTRGVLNNTASAGGDIASGLWDRFKSILPQEKPAAAPQGQP